MPTTAVPAGPRCVSRSAVIAAPAAELFELVADPRRHGELDGSGTVQDTVSGPARLGPDARFSVRMRQYGVPYRITSAVTAFDDGRLVEWRHPMGHRWRWAFEPLSATTTRVTESFDYSHSPAVAAKGLELLGVPTKNGAGIDATLEGLQARYH